MKEVNVSVSEVISWIFKFKIFIIGLIMLVIALINLSQK